MNSGATQRTRDIGARDADVPVAGPARDCIVLRDLTSSVREVPVMAEQQALDGRLAIVTGAASGMGRVMARALAASGARVAAVDIDAAGLNRLAAEPVFAGKFLGIAADVSKAADCRGAVRRA